MIPWIYLLITTPTAYRSNLKTLRENPEIAGLLHRWAGTVILRRLALIPLGILLSPLMLLAILSMTTTAILDRIDRYIPRPLAPLYRKADGLHWEINNALQNKRVRG